MSLLLKIKDDLLVARKAKETVKVNLLTTLYSEAANEGLNDGKRESTDTEVLAVIKKFLKNLKETREAIGDTDLTLRQESAILENYLPNQLTYDKLRAIIFEVISVTGSSTMRDMGTIMASLKQSHDGQYDGKMASEIVKEFLS